MAEPETAPPSPAPTGFPSHEGATVDARDYQEGERYYFQSPTGNIMCGFINRYEIGTGCQLSSVEVVPPELSDCRSQPDRAIAAQVVGGVPRFMCLNQGIFVGSPPEGTPRSPDGTYKGGGNVLEYGDTIVVGNTSCTSMPTGVRCDQDGHGFMVAADQQHLF